MKKTIKILGIALAVLFVLIIFLPYLIPLSKPLAPEANPPFSNSAFERLEDTTLHYRLYPHEGEKQEGKLLMVHGFGGSTYSFEKIAPHFAKKGYDVVLVDLPGFGYSARSASQNHAQMYRAYQLWTLLERLDADLGDAPWHLAGHSMGGGTVTGMAMLEPEQTASLILINAALFDGASERNALFKLPFVKRWVQIGLDYGIISEKNIEKLLESAYGQPPRAEDIAGYLLPLRQPGTHLTFPALMDTSENVPISGLTYLKVPAVAIWGELDSWVPVSDTQRIKEHLSQLYVEVIEGAGHCPMETHEAAFIAILEGWLNAE